MPVSSRRDADPPSVGPRDWRPLCLALRDETDALVGGLYGASMWCWLLIDGFGELPDFPPGHVHYELWKPLAPPATLETAVAAVATQAPSDR